MIKGLSMRNMERLAKHLPDGAAKQKLLDDFAALREVKAAYRRVRAEYLEQRREVFRALGREVERILTPT
jgi:thermostable 8-oxoguanine DNA glycosylase